MKKALLFCFFFTLLLIASCSKSPGSVTENTTPPSKVFVPVQLIGVKGGWGGALCNFDFILIRLDTSLIYHSIAVPHDAHIYTPVNVNIQFHDTVTLFPGCWQHEIVIDSIKP